MTIRQFFFILLITPFFALGQDTTSTKGLSGFIQLTGGITKYRANTVAGFLRNNVSNPTISSIYDKPDAQTSGTVLSTFDLKYTFNGQKHQLFVGSSIQDIIRLDIVQQAAFRWLKPNRSFISVGMLFSTLPVSVWSDPFMENEPRQVTTRLSRGFRFEWAKIAKSSFGLQYDLRNIQLEENSGKWLNLDPDQQDLLDRNGPEHRVTINYETSSNPNLRWVPTIRISYYDADGQARKGLTTFLEGNLAYRDRKLAGVSSLFATTRSFFEEHPIYQEKQRNLGFGARQVFYYSLNRHFLATASALYAYSWSNIEFYSLTSLIVQGGLMFRWP